MEDSRPASPLRAALARLRTIDESFALPIAGRESDGWIPASELGTRGRGSVRAALASFTRDGAQERRVQAAWFVQGYAWLLAAPAAACLLSEGPVPCLVPDNVAFRTPPGEGFAELAIVDERRVAEGDVGILRSSLERHLDSLLAHPELGTLGRRARALLASDACATAFLFAGERLGCEERSVAALREFLAPAGSLQAPANLLRVNGAGAPRTVRRRCSCCLAYRVAGLERCEDCPLPR
jgi:hypothetical protein